MDWDTWYPDKSNLGARILELNNDGSRDDCSSCGKQQNMIKIDCRHLVNAIFDDDLVISLYLNVLIDKLKNKCNYNDHCIYFKLQNMRMAPKVLIFIFVICGDGTFDVLIVLSIAMNNLFVYVLIEYGNFATDPNIDWKKLNYEMRQRKHRQYITRKKTSSGVAFANSGTIVVKKYFDKTEETISSVKDVSLNGNGINATTTLESTKTFCHLHDGKNKFRPTIIIMVFLWQ